MSRHRACDDFHRSSENVRRDYLGGPALTRRQVLGAGLGAGLALYTAQALPVTRVLEAAAADAAAAPNAPVLVSVFLPGGVDLLDTLVPLHDYGRYADLHPQLKVQGVPLPGTPSACTLRLPVGSAVASRDSSSEARSAFSQASTTPIRTSRTSTPATSGRPA